MSEEISEEFDRAISIGGAAVGTCGLCDRVLFSTSYMDEPETREMQAKAKEQPDKYIEVGGDAVGVARLNGMAVVPECPCNKLRRYEDFIWDNRDVIITYLKARTAREKREADAIVNDLEGLQP